MPQVVIRLHNAQLKRDYKRAVELLGTSQSAALYRCIIGVIRRAKAEFPHAWSLLNDYEELIIESIEVAQPTTVDQIAKYTRLPKEQITALLPDLIEQGLIVEADRLRSERVHGGPVTKTYSIGKKVQPRQQS